MIFLILSLYLCHSAQAEKTAPDLLEVNIGLLDYNDSKPALFKKPASPVWDPIHECLYFVDSDTHNISRISFPDYEIETRHVECEGDINTITLIEDSSRLLLTAGSSLYLFDFNKQGEDALELLSTFEQGSRDSIAVGKADANGRFWGATKCSDKKAGGTLYSVDENSFDQPAVRQKNICISSGLTWSLNNTVLYFIDAPTGLIQAFEFELETGALSGRRTILNVTAAGVQVGVPSDLTIDSDGKLWATIMYGGMVIRIDPDSKELMSAYEVPAFLTSSVAFGGPDLDVLFVLTGQDDVDTSTNAGAVFMLTNFNSTGVPPKAFDFKFADTYRNKNN